MAAKPIRLRRDDYRDKVLACWLGKNIGGTLGAPFEWKRQINSVSFYPPEIQGQSLPNDDLDIQLLWLIALEENGPRIDAKLLAEYWLHFLTPHWMEYGVAKRNLRAGLPPPLSGSFANPWKDSCGAFIRSEIWACIAPGMPDVAAEMALQDAILDHGDGEGTYAEVFCATLQSAAFVESDLRWLIDLGLSYIPESCGIARAVRCALACFDSGKAWQETRDEILRGHRGSCGQTSAEDREKGFRDGPSGYDAPSNIAITILGLLYGGDDFDRMVCTTVNCGEDTDCTAATAAAIFGITRGTRALPDRWLAPIGRKIVTACLNLGDLGCYGDLVPQTVDELTDRVERIARQVAGSGARSRVEFSPDQPTDLSSLSRDTLLADDHGARLYGRLQGPTFHFEGFSVYVDYGSALAADPGVTRKVRIEIINRWKTSAYYAVRWFAPASWKIAPARAGFVTVYPWAPGAVEFEVECEPLSAAFAETALLEVSVEGRAARGAVPVTFVNCGFRPQP